MSASLNNLKSTVAACMTAVWFSLPAVAETGALQPLYDQLRGATSSQAAQIEREIALERKRSGSVAMDLLLQRGFDALDRAESLTAIEHFSAVIDHAPEIAEGWYGRARAFYEKGDLGQALSDLSQALTLDPGNYEAIFGLAAIFEGLDQPHKALAAYRLALEAHPNYEEAAEAVKRLEPQVGGKSL